MRALRLNAGAMMVLAAAAARAEPARYEIDPDHAVVAFLVEHIGFARVLGNFADVEGSFVFDEESGVLSDLAVTVGTSSVSSDHEARDEHLRSDDFLNTGTHPAMSFTASGARRTGEREFGIDGELTLLGVTRPLTLDATWNKSGAYPIGRDAYAIGVSARATLDRGDFGMRYALDNGWVGNDVSIIIEIEARRQ
jgi:polyisoprenoid-binding protein YceI